MSRQKAKQLLGSNQATAMKQPGNNLGQPGRKQTSTKQQLATTRQHLASYQA
jgi:hypothetical protein